MRMGLIVLGLALGVLWVAGLVGGVAAWMVWIDFAVSLASLLAAFVPEEMPQVLAATPIALSVALLVTWLIGLAEGVPGWMAWWTFAFGAGYAVLSFVGKTEATSMTEGVEKRPTLSPR